MGKLLVAFVVGAVAFLIYKGLYPTETYKYRLAMAIEVNGVAKQASSVIEVASIAQPAFGSAPPARNEISGQAVLLNVGDRSAIVAALNTGGNSDVEENAVAAAWLVPMAFGGGRSLSFQEASKVTGSRLLTEKNLPRLIFFSDISDPKTARKIHPGDIPDILGSSSKFIGVSVEKTKDKLFIDLDKRLPWYSMLKERREIPISYGFSLTRAMFVGAGSW